MNRLTNQRRSGRQIPEMLLLGMAVSVSTAITFGIIQSAGLKSFIKSHGALGHAALILTGLAGAFFLFCLFTGSFDRRNKNN